jgi:predicted aldo/keto reductase-like oxidoreductase
MQNRRNFLKSGLAAAAGAGFAGNSLAGHVNPLTGEEDKFVYRTLGKTGFKIPVISMGTGNCNNPRLIKEAADRGVILFATSEYYQNGNNEKMVGGALKDRPRDSYMIMTGTAAGISIDHRNGLFKEGSDPEKYLEGVNGCLERLQVDCLDVLSMGFGARRESVFFDPLLKAVQKVKEQGKAKYLNLATHSFEPEAVRAASDTGVYDLVTVAYNFKHDKRLEIDQALQYAVDKGLGVICMKAMAGAFWDKEKTRPINGPAALKWVLRNKNIHTVIPDVANFDHLDQDLAIMENLELTDKDRQLLEPPAPDVSSGLYCRQCRECLQQCPEGIDIPTLMRSYMYAYGYRNLELSRKTLEMAGLTGNPCTGCRSCRVKCSAGFDVRGKICDIARIREIPEDIIKHV